MQFGLSDTQLSAINQGRIMRDAMMPLINANAMNKRIMASYSEPIRQIRKQISPISKELLATLTRHMRIQRETMARLQQSLVVNRQLMEAVHRMQTVTPTKVNRFVIIYYWLEDFLENETIKKILSIGDKVINAINFLFRMNEAVANISSIESHVVVESLKSFGSWLMNFFTG